MATIKDIQAIDLNKIKNKNLKDTISDLISDYNNAQDKDKALEIIDDSIQKLYSIVAKINPEAISKTSPCEEDTPAPVKKKKTTKEKTRAKKQEKKTSSYDPTDSEFEKLKEEIKVCRVKLKEFNAQKREMQPPKAKPTRYDKIKGHYLAIGNLIPESLKDNLPVQKKVKKLLLQAFRDTIDVFGMSQLRAKKNIEAIEEKYDKIEEKLNPKTS